VRRETARAKEVRRETARAKEVRRETARAKEVGRETQLIMNILSKHTMIVRRTSSPRCMRK